MKYFLYSCILVVIFSPSAFLNAQSTCGIVISQADEDSLPYKPPFITEPIDNCTDPFDLTNDLPMPYRLQVNNNLYDTGANIATENGELPLPLEFEGEPMYSQLWPFLFKHQGSDFVYVNQFPTELPSPTEDEVREYAETYFDTEASADLYTEIYFANDQQSYFEDENGDMAVDQETGDYVRNRFNGFLEYIGEQRTVLPEPIGPGTYTLVFDEYELILSQRTWLERIRDILVTTAFAQYFEPRRFAITFTLEEVQPEGASSVLFLPGIQASRLYKEGGLDREDKIWEPDVLLSQDVRQLEMDSNGISQNDIYTRDIMDAIPLGGTVYDSFARFMVRLVADEVIEGWTPFAYDWRYSVSNIAQNGTQYEEGIRDAIDEIEYLASSSFSGKVTIISHSNGGLLAKAIMMRLEQEGKTDLVDKVILLASPQLGTPKAIGTVLHGYDQEKLGGWLIDDVVARGVINNMPGAYALLPSEKYFEGVSEPIITFSGDAIVNSYRGVYGDSISNYAEYVSFMQGSDGLDRGLNNPASVPARANSSLFNEALSIHNTQLDTWSAPEGVEVIEIVGTGLPTMKSAEYRGVVEDDCVVSIPFNLFCTPTAEIKPFAVLTHYGDGTVVQHSAEGYEGEKSRYFVNLEELKRVFLTSKYVHHNVTEIPSLQELISDIIVGTSTENNQFISNTHTEFDDPYDIEIIDSPVRLLSTDSQGNQTGVIIVDGIEIIKDDIPGSQYFEFGDTKYLVVPKGTNRITKLYGEDYGGYTLTTAELRANDVQTVKTALSNAKVTPDLIAEYSNTDGEFSTVVTDVNGDGIIDYETTLDGELIEEEVVITYPLLISTIQALSLSKIHKQALIVIIKSAEQYANKTPSRPLYRRLEDGLLTSANELIKLYVKKSYMTSADAIVLQDMIQVLKDKQ